MHDYGDDLDGEVLAKRLELLEALNRREAARVRARAGHAEIGEVIKEDPEYVEEEEHDPEDEAASSAHSARLAFIKRLEVALGWPHVEPEDGAAANLRLDELLNAVFADAPADEEDEDLDYAGDEDEEYDPERDPEYVKLRDDAVRFTAAHAVRAEPADEAPGLIDRRQPEPSNGSALLGLGVLALLAAGLFLCATLVMILGKFFAWAWR